MEISKGWPRVIWNTALLIFAVVLFYLLRESFIPIVFAIILFYILNPWVEMLEKIKFPRWLAIVVTFVVFIYLIALFIKFIVPPLIIEFSKFKTNIPQYISTLKHFYAGLRLRYDTIHMPESIRIAVDQGFQNFIEFLVRVTQNAAAYLLSLFSQLIKLLLIPLLTFFFLKDKEKIRNALVDAAPKDLKEGTRKLFSRINLVLTSFIKGQLTLCLVVGSIAMVGLYLLKVEYAFILGLIAGVTEAIPILGPWIGAIPAVMVALIISPLLALKVILLYLIIQALENYFLVPKVMGGYLKLHPITIVLAIIACGELMGPLGFFLATPLAAILKEVYLHLKN